MRVTIDTSEAKSFELAEPGPYEMSVAAISEPKKGANSTYVEVQYAFSDPKMDQQCGKIFRNYPITGKGAGFFREFWKAATGEDIPVGTQIDVDLDNAIGRPVIVDVGHESYEGRTRNAAQKVIGVGS